MAILLYLRVMERFALKRKDELSYEELIKELREELRQYGYSEAQIDQYIKDLEEE